MEQLSEVTSKLSVEELKNHPELLANFIAKNQNSRFLIEGYQLKAGQFALINESLIITKFRDRL